ncbi:MAG TPA: hypothetical protein VEI57_13580 [Nitrospirota bacterium]|nr:hypothetical protein [Nitrospirota bacterium]
MTKSPKSWHSHRSCSRILLAGLFIYAFFLNGCMAGKTRSLPFTEYPPADAINLRAGKFVIEVDPFDIGSTEIKGGHHEGLLQVRQPWIWGLSNEQKEALYGDLANIVRYAFIDEFLRRNQRVILPGYSAPTGRIDYAITGTVRSVELNTYGQGTREGFGSAGNYWEATIEMSDVRILRYSDNKAIWQGDIMQYCKLQESPVKLDWTIFTVIRKSLENRLTLSKGATPARIDKVVENSAGDYELEPLKQNPVEIAARLAAIDVLKRIVEQPRSESKSGDR